MVTDPSKVSKADDIFEHRSRFEENSNVDQDDAYGNYRPQFLVKKHKVTGRTEEIMKLQRIASLDHNRGLLAPVQPDLTAQKVSQKKIFNDKSNVQTHNHIEHPVEEKQKTLPDGSPLPKQDHYFRKAVEGFTHD